MTLSLGDFDFSYPSHLIAKHPLEPRDHSRLLVSNVQTQAHQEHVFCELPQVLQQVFGLGTKRKRLLLVVNDTKTYPARIRIHKKTGAQGEVFLLNYTAAGPLYSCLLRPQNKLKVGDTLFARDEPVFVVRALGTNPQVELVPGNTLPEVLKKFGEVPLPPYLSRAVESQDVEHYQTVYAHPEHIGSAAAPTAGFHFTEFLMQKLKECGVEFAPVTLHVGLGTFAPVQNENIAEHPMHHEQYCLGSHVYETLCDYQRTNDPIVFVGTTSLRCVESFFRLGEDERQERLNVWNSTNLFLYPEHKNHKIQPVLGQGMITNFHQPASTLAMLVAALMGYEFWQRTYGFAIENNYRLFSYGDSNLITWGPLV